MRVCSKILAWKARQLVLVKRVAKEKQGIFQLSWIWTFQECVTRAQADLTNKIADAPGTPSENSFWQVTSDLLSVTNQLLDFTSGFEKFQEQKDLLISSREESFVTFSSSNEVETTSWLSSCVQFQSLCFDGLQKSTGLFRNSAKKGTIHCLKSCSVISGNIYEFVWHNISKLRYARQELQHKSW